jgi:hypothetical protein
VNDEMYIGLDVHQGTISVAVMDSRGKIWLLNVVAKTVALLTPRF